jgi:hypothetical protein
MKIESPDEASIAESVLNKIRNPGSITETTWFSEYRDPEFYKHYFDGRNTNYYSEWRMNLLNRCFDLNQFRNETDSIPEILRVTLRFLTLPEDGCRGRKRTTEASAKRSSR